MKLPPAWKVKRELFRVKEQVQDALLPRFADRLRQFWHDRNIGKRLVETPGALAITPRVAVFVLFQPKGVAESTFLTLDHLVQENWSALVISNVPLSSADRLRLAARSAHVIERPNVGYDFGAYREGWRWLIRHHHGLDRLILMNDSTWFPLRMQDDSLRRMEALDADLTGHIFKTEKSEAKGRDHIESHLLMLGSRALGHPRIQTFWSHYPMTNSKALTIQRGEKGIAQTALAAGLKVEGLLGRQRLIDLLACLSDEALLDMLRNLALHNETGRHERDAWLSAAAQHRPWRSGFLDWASRELSNSRQHLLSATFIDPAIALGGMGFVKKSAERRFHLARLALMRSIATGRIAPLDPVVETEIQAAIRNWRPPQDWRANPNQTQITEL